MSHTFRILQILLFCLLVFPCQAKALELTRNLPTSARDMEFYYQHKHPESLPGMLRAFDKNRRFAHGELRLITAAFLAEIFKNEPEQTSKLLDLAKDLSPEAQKLVVLRLPSSVPVQISVPRLVPTEGCPYENTM